MKIVFGRFALASLGCALVASSWLALASAQDLRLKNEPTLAAPRSSVELRTGPTLSAQKQTGTATGATPSTRTITPAPSPSTYSPNPAPTTSKWAPAPASAPLTSAPVAGTPIVTADPVSTSLPPRDASAESPVRLSVGTLSPTPEMWFYEQMRQDLNNPEMIVRRRSEQAAAERKARIASRAWYGVSLARPSANVTPFTYHYSPSWASNTRHPFSWLAPQVAAPVVIEARRPYVGLSGFGAW
jgi:hypothetical protein